MDGAATPPPASALKFRKHLIGALTASWVLVLAQLVAVFVYRELQWDHRQDALLVHALLAAWGSYALRRMDMFWVLMWGLACFMIFFWVLAQILFAVCFGHEDIHSEYIRQPKDWTIAKMRKVIVIFRVLSILACIVSMVAAFYVYRIMKGYRDALRTVEQTQRNVLGNYGTLSQPQAPEHPSFTAFQGPGRTLGED